MSSLAARKTRERNSVSVNAEEKKLRKTESSYANLQNEYILMADDIFSYGLLILQALVGDAPITKDCPHSAGETVSTA